MRAIAEEAFAHGARLQGLAFRRAWRRHRALGVPRGDVRRAAGARLRGGEGPLRSGRPVQSRQDRARAEIRRPRALFRYGPDYRGEEIETRLDWSAYPGAGGGFQGAVEMCNNNGACRKLAGGVMCPSYRVTRDERDVTRGRANTLRLAITGQLGPDALTSDEMAETLKLCVSCKALPARMPDRRRHGAHEDRGAGRARRTNTACRCTTGWSAICRATRRYARKVPWLLNLRDRLPGAAKLSEAIAGFSARRTLPRWRCDVFRGLRMRPRGHRRVAGARSCCSPTPSTAMFERENLDAALDGAQRRRLPRACRQPRRRRSRPLCCGRTFLSVGARRRGAARGGARASPRSSPSSRAACRWSGSSRAASSASATRSRP